jgi:AbiV family abortive infection protein
MQTAAKKLEGSATKLSFKEMWDLGELHGACMRNAVELKEEAELLLLSKRFARAVSLALTALEELGKAQLVADRIDGCASQKEFEQIFNRHELKAAYVSRVIELELGPNNAVIGGSIKYDLEKGKQIFKLRCDSLYVEWDGSKPSTPQQCISPELSVQVVNYVKKAIENEVVIQDMTEEIGTRSQLK